jgi:predicted alpha/beta hydrolase
LGVTNAPLTRRDLRVQERSIGHKGLKIRSPNMEGVAERVGEPRWQT